MRCRGCSTLLALLGTFASGDAVDQGWQDVASEVHFAEYFGEAVLVCQTLNRLPRTTLFLRWATAGVQC